MISTAARDSVVQIVFAAVFVDLRGDAFDNDNVLLRLQGRGGFAELGVTDGITVISKPLQIFPNHRFQPGAFAVFERGALNTHRCLLRHVNVPVVVRMPWVTSQSRASSASCSNQACALPRRKL